MFIEWLVVPERFLSPTRFASSLILHYQEKESVPPALLYLTHNMNVLAAELLKAAEKAAHIARICRLEKVLFQLLEGRCKEHEFHARFPDVSRRVNFRDDKTQRCS